MSEVTVKGGLSQENAILLLAAVEEAGKDASLVRTTSKGFVAPKDIVKAAGLESYDPDKEFNDEIAEAEKAVEAKPEPQDGTISGGEAPPALDDEGNLVEVKAEGPPAKNASKSDWAEYAKSQGETDESLTKEALIEQYGNKE